MFHNHSKKKKNSHNSFFLFERNVSWLLCFGEGEREKEVGGKKLTGIVVYVGDGLITNYI